MLPTTPLVGLSERDVPTENGAEAMFVPSDATIVCAPFGTVGITTAHEKVPFGRDVVQVEAATTRSSVNEMGALAANPVPVAVVELPTTPPVGFNERAASTVNVAGAWFVPSNAVTVWMPWGAAGMVTGHEKPPVEFEEQVEGADDPSSVKVIV